MKTLASDAVDVSLPETKGLTFLSGMRINMAEVKGRSQAQFIPLEGITLEGILSV